MADSLTPQRRAHLVAVSSDDPSTRAAVDRALTAWEREPVGTAEEVVVLAVLDAAHAARG